MADAPKEIGLKWENTDELPVAACNVFVAQFTPHEFTLTFGYATPPAIFTEQDAVNVKTVRVNPIIRLSLSPGRMRELVEVLKGNLEKYQQAQLAPQASEKIKH